ncbi:uncharacterized protein METZ01_LOCUS310322 [marine metagenome]|uniref:Uncharacterized protein n=1 Tax=marine metagenome TaxID=408172 RepID=A0A382NAA6_9ZZZZ
MQGMKFHWSLLLRNYLNYQVIGRAIFYFIMMAG